MIFAELLNGEPLVALGAESSSIRIVDGLRDQRAFVSRGWFAMIEPSLIVVVAPAPGYSSDLASTDTARPKLRDPICPE